MSQNVIFVIIAIIIVVAMFVMNNIKEQNKKEVSQIKLLDIKESTEIELTRELVRLQRLQLKKSNRMLNNLLWFFWLSIIYLIAGFIVFVNYV